MTTVFGKTVVAASLIVKRKVNTLVIVNRKQLMEQWKERLVTFLDIDEKCNCFRKKLEYMFCFC